MKAFEMSATDEQLKRVSTLAKRQLTLETKVKLLEEQLDLAIHELDDVRRTQLPELMQEIGLAKIQLDTGENVEIKDVVKAAITEANKQAAFGWLRANGHGSLIKNDITAHFGMGEESQARSLLETLNKQGLSVDQKEAVHGNTLTAFVKEQIRNAKPVPMELFGVMEFSEAKITNKGRKS